MTRIKAALGIYALLTLAYFALAAPDRLASHTPYNHYALQAEAWLDGRLALDGPPPAYTGNNDFAVFEGRHYVSFPPVPALFLLPAVALAGSAEATNDGVFFLSLAPLGPVLLFFSLERLRRRTGLSRLHNAGLAVAFGLGTVYWFTAVQGTVWFAGHVVGVVMLCGYLWAACDARHPWLAGLCLALAIGTRPSLAFAAPFFLAELWRADVDRRRLVAFLVPLAIVGLGLAWHNHVRFGDWLEFGHRHLAIRWRDRIDRHGLFAWRYLGRNLAVMLTSLPFPGGPLGVRVGGHGLALWITTPIYAWALWPRRATPLFKLAAVCALAVAIPNLLYQNTGWLQFGYRFSNDFAPLLFIMIAAGRRRLGSAFWLLAALGLVVNAFGAATFDRAAHRHHYVFDASQNTLHP